MSIYNNKGFIIRLLYLFIASLFYILTCGGKFLKDKTVVLCYHGVPEYLKTQFIWQISRIRAMNAKTNIIYDKEPGHHKIQITFDDAFKNLLDNAIPVLRRFEVPAKIFVVAGNTGETPHWEISPGHPDAKEKTMTIEELKTLSSDSLFRIGSHTMNHKNLAVIPLHDVQHELFESKKRLESFLEYTVEDFAFPHGSYNETVLASAKLAGYKHIYTLDPILNNRESAELIKGRFSMSPDIWRIEFILTCTGCYTWLYPLRKLLNAVRKKSNNQRFNQII